MAGDFGICEVHQHKASQKYRCDLCGKEIDRGTDYIAADMEYGGRWVTRRLHIHCDAMVQATKDKAYTGGAEYGCLDADYVRNEVDRRVCVDCPENDGYCELERITCMKAIMRLCKGPYMEILASLMRVK